MCQHVFYTTYLPIYLIPYIPIHKFKLTWGRNYMRREYKNIICAYGEVLKLFNDPIPNHFNGTTLNYFTITNFIGTIMFIVMKSDQI